MASNAPPRAIDRWFATLPWNDADCARNSFRIDRASIDRDADAPAAGGGRGATVRTCHALAPRMESGGANQAVSEGGSAPRVG